MRETGWTLEYIQEDLDLWQVDQVLKGLGELARREQRAIDAAARR